MDIDALFDVFDDKPTSASVAPAAAPKTTATSVTNVSSPSAVTTNSMNDSEAGDKVVKGKDQTRVRKSSEPVSIPPTNETKDAKLSTDSQPSAKRLKKSDGSAISTVTGSDSNPLVDSTGSSSSSSAVLPVPSAATADTNVDLFGVYTEQLVVGSAKAEKAAPGEKTCAMQVCFPPGWSLKNEDEPLNDEGINALAQATARLACLDYQGPRAADAAKRNKEGGDMASDSDSSALRKEEVDGTLRVKVKKSKHVVDHVDTAYAVEAEKRAEKKASEAMFMGDSNPGVTGSRRAEDLVVEKVADRPTDDDGMIVVRPPEPAKTYKFNLDPFQLRAVESIEKGQSVLVAAHTSAGKTVVAEYAIAHSLKRKQRVIYTSPIKALSNQKFRELQEEFADVGLMTGDVTINPSASCLVMTTEILRNMLYRGSEVVKELKWVIFDEIHYMRDRSRGVVWEETIILLPPRCAFVFLSATIPNASEFALWVAKLHRRPCLVVYTDFRPTPLQHYVYPTGGDGLYLVYDEKGVFRDGNFHKALSKLEKSDDDIGSGGSGKKGGKGGADGEGAGGKGKGAQGKKGGTSEVYKVVKLVTEKKLDPAIVFSFSKKDCETHALECAKLDLCTEEEKSLITQIYKNAMEALNDDDKKLPQVQNFLPLLRCGIGVHHGGLLPILKEVIEILFQENLIKVLFATETFAMGLNMPARTVVFTQIEKFDGVIFRHLNSGEYIQMSGRAGRRGLDDKGLVIMMMKSKIEPDQARAMITGDADALKSSFHLGYNMLLNLLRVEDADPEYLMSRSFFQFQQQRSVPILIEWAQKINAKLQSLPSPQHVLNIFGYNTSTSSTSSSPSLTVPPSILTDLPVLVRQLYSLIAEYRSARLKVRQVATMPDYCRPFLQTGRLIKLKASLSAILNAHPSTTPAKSASSSSTALTPSSQSSTGANGASSSQGSAPSLGPGGVTLTLESFADVIPADVDSIQDKKITQTDIDWGWGVVLASGQRHLPKAFLHGDHASAAALANAGSATSASTGRGKDTRESARVMVVTFVVDVLLAVDPDSIRLLTSPSSSSTSSSTSSSSSSSSSAPASATNVHDLSRGDCDIQLSALRPCPKGKRPKFLVIPVLLSAIEEISQVRMNVSATKLSENDAQVTGQKLIEAINRLSQTSIPNASSPSSSSSSLNDVNDVALPPLLPLPLRDLGATFTINNISLPSLPASSTTTGTNASSNPSTSTTSKTTNKKSSSQTSTASSTTVSSSSSSTSSSPSSSSETSSPELTLDDLLNMHITTPGLLASSPRVPVLDPVTDMKVEDAAFTRLVTRVTQIQQRITTHPLVTQLPNVVVYSLLLFHAKRLGCEDALKALERKVQGISQDEGLHAMLGNMKRVMRRLGFVDESDVLTTKGRVACELSTCDELIGTELLFSNIFSDLNAAINGILTETSGSDSSGVVGNPIGIICALLSCLVFDEPQEDELPKFTHVPAEDQERMTSGYKKLQDIGKKVYDVLKDCRIFNPAVTEVTANGTNSAAGGSGSGASSGPSAQQPQNKEDNNYGLNPFLMEAVYLWCAKAKFSQICKVTTVFEGTIIRSLRRLEELLKQLVLAAKSIGNQALEKTFMDCINAIKRDIVFAASLYL